MTSSPMQKMFSINKFNFWYAGKGLMYKGIFFSFFRKKLNDGGYPKLFQIRIIPFNRLKTFLGKVKDV